MKQLSLLKKALILSFICNIIGIIAISFFVYTRGGYIYVANKINRHQITHPSEYTPYYNQKKTLFELLPNIENNIVFIGDSITDGSEWGELFKRNDILNRGIGCDSTRGVLDRIDEITTHHPSKIFIMIGINDLHLFNSNVDDIVERYKNILYTIKNDSPNTKIYIQSVLPINNKFIKNVKNQDIIQLNNRLQLIARESNCTYVDLHSVFYKDDALNLEYSNDGIHLTGNGYLVWKDSIDQYINE